MKLCHPETFQQELFPIIVKSSVGPIEPLLEHCPFCSETTGSGTTMEDHVAKQLRLFAIRSLPGIEDDLDTERGPRASIELSKGMRAPLLQ